MADTKKICEEIEIAIYSDAELTDEQKQHIENCENCRALLSQVSSMKNELGNLSVPGIREGEIADKVMQAVAMSKKSIPFPKFRITHHLGTAAAIVIIFTAALLLKNPADNKFTESDSENNTSDIIFETNKNDHVLNGISDAAEMYNETEDKQNDIIMRTASPVQNEAEQDSEDSVINSVYDYYAEYTKEEALYDSTSDSINQSLDTEQPKMMFKAPLADAYTEDSEENTTLLADDFDKQVLATGSSGGSSMTDSATAQTQTDSKYIFDGLEFLDGEENFDYNIRIANERLVLLYGKEYVVSKQKLESLGVDNKKLLKIAPTVTQDMFNFYKNIFDIFE